MSTATRYKHVRSEVDQACKELVVTRKKFCFWLFQDGR